MTTYKTYLVHFCGTRAMDISTIGLTEEEAKNKAIGRWIELCNQNADDLLTIKPIVKA